MRQESEEKLSNELEALKLLNDWSKWLVTIETAAIGIIGTLLKLGKQDRSIGQSQWLIAVASIGCFMVSIVAASWLIMSIPGMAQRIGRPSQVQDVFRKNTYFGRARIRLRLDTVTGVQLIFFLAGLLFFVAFMAQGLKIATS